MLNKAKTFFFQHLNNYRTNKILKLYDQGKYTQIARVLNNYQRYQSIKVEKNPLVYHLIKQQNIDCLSRFLKDINYSKQVLNQQITEYQSKPYQLAYLINNNAIDTLMKDNGYPLNYIDEDKKTILHVAAMNNNVSLILKALDNDNNINAKDIDGMTPLHYAAECGKTEAVQILLNNGANIKIMDQQNKYPLHYAILSQNYDCFKILFDISKDLDFKQVQKPFITACQQTNIKILSEIYKNNKGSIYHLGQNNFSALHYAAFIDNVQVASFLIQNKALLNHQDEYGYTPIHLAIVQDHVNITKYLHSKGADLYIKADTGLNALDSGMLMKDSQVIKFLKKIDMKDNKI